MARQHLGQARLILTVTPGRSGTRLLAAILGEIPGILAEHEAAPMLNYVLRGVQAEPRAARWWLWSEKLPVVAARLAASGAGIYADTSHLYAKGFLEPLLDLGLCADLILLTRPARAVATSLLAVGAVPHRSGAGRLALLGPEDPGVVVPEGWRGWNDYQLCFWYVREMERRQRIHAATWPGKSLWLDMADMTDAADPARLAPLFDFVGGRADPDRLAALLAVDQNPRARVTPSGAAGPAPPAEIAAAEAAVDAALADLKPGIPSS
ncbi:MAG: hypothetical protein ACWA5A_10790 [Marinibacterium sp.]